AAVAQRMADRKAGAIVSLMGDSGRVGEAGLLVTATARSTTVGLTRSLAKELARFGIRTNAVSLALVRTHHYDEHSGGADADPERTKKILAQYPLRRLGRAVAHATITSVDAEAAREAGYRVFTGADFAGVTLRAKSALPSYVETAQPVLAHTVARFAGEAVAAVVAADRYLAEDGCELVE